MKMLKAEAVARLLQNAGVDFVTMSKRELKKMVVEKEPNIRSCHPHVLEDYVNEVAKIGLAA